ncbi:hypothetical protein [Pseudofulvibacter geojedonensis]|uniref:Uncharacterized protein n=1 Tax=Pseudofulvibacter geojedonensis TaxID=1123758 RepID=A0ABW3I5T4_9FLAO
MKKIFVLAFLIISSTSFAQERRGQHHRKGKMEMMKDLSPEQMATLKTKKMTLALDLTESQQKKIYDFNLKNATVRKAKIEAHKAAIKKNTDKKLALSADEKYNRANERLDQQIAMKKELSAILTKEQLEKMEQMRERRKMRKKKAHMRKKLEK